MSRATKLTTETHLKIVSLCKAGNYRETAAAAAGIDQKTLRNWLHRGATGEEPFATFSADLDEAEAWAEARDIALIAAAAKKDWKAAAWRLERKSKKKWARDMVPETQAQPVTVNIVTADKMAEKKEPEK